jgi:hypothetical protein
MTINYGEMNMERKTLLENYGYDASTLVVTTNAEYFYQGGDCWRRPFVCKVAGTAGNLERWDAGYLLEDEDGVYDLTLSSSGLSAEEASRWL